MFKPILLKQCRIYLNVFFERNLKKGSFSLLAIYQHVNKIIFRLRRISQRDV